MYNTNIKNCNNQLLDLQKKQLIDEIINGSKKGYFKIFDIEAGCKKTRTAEEALAKLVQTTDKNAIMVRRTNEDCIESANNINNLTGYEVAFAYNNETVPYSQRLAVHKNFSKYRILIITHQKYIVLAENARKRNVFTKNRSVLVVDEFISDYKKISISKKIMDTYKAIFGYDSVILRDYLQLTKWLEDFTTSNPTGRCFARIKAEFPSKKIQQLKKLINNNLNDYVLKDRIEKVLNDEELASKTDIELLSTIKTKKQLCSFIEDIKEFYNKTIVVENGTYHTTDSKCKYWFLDNNILLDASGKLQIAYELNYQLYSLVNCTKVLDHKNWTIINVEVNTTKAGKKRLLNFYDEVNKTVQYYGAENTLVIGNKSDINYITTVPECNKAYFGNITGSNKWANLNNVIIMQTPNINDTDYVLQYLHYTCSYIDNTFAKWTSKSTGRGTTARYEFTDPRFERIRTLFTAEQTYQAIKRVNRNMDHITNVVIYMNNPNVIKLLQENLKGCKIQIINNTNFIYRKTKRDKYIEDLNSNSYAAKFIKLMAELWDGKHPELKYKAKDSVRLYLKKDIREYLGITSSAKFSNRVLINTDVIRYCELRNILTNGKFIKLTNYKNKIA